MFQKGIVHVFVFISREVKHVNRVPLALKLPEKIERRLNGIR